MLNVGDKVPDLLGTDENSKEIRLSDFPGKKVALYFYPKDNTSGCTAQACTPRDPYAALFGAGYPSVGIIIPGMRFQRKALVNYSLQLPVASVTL